jgi:hypothetical protein
MTGGRYYVKIEACDRIFALLRKRIFGRLEGAGVVGYDRAEHIALGKHIRVALVDSDGNTYITKVADGKDMVEMSVGKKNKSADRVGAVERILNNGKVGAGVDNDGVARVGGFNYIAIRSESTYGHSFNYHIFHILSPNV